MKICTWATVLLVMLAAKSTLAADGLPSEKTLSKLGLAEMQLVSDEEGMEVRGKAFGTLTLTIPVFDLGTGTVTGISLGTSTFGNSPAIVGPGTGPINRFGSVGTASVFLDPATGLVDTVVDGGALTITVPVVDGNGGIALVPVTFTGTLFAGGQ